jgi:O-antigen/teichoic acid export membrane protein
MNLLFAMINQLMVPIIFERAGAMTSAVQVIESEALIRKTILVSALLSLFVIGVSLLLGEPIIRLLTSARYAEHHELLWLTVCGIAIFNVGQLFALRGISRNQPRIYLWPKGAQAASFLALAYFLARWQGLPGVALALCVSSLVYLAAVVVTNKRLISIQTSQ